MNNHFAFGVLCWFVFDSPYLAMFFWILAIIDTIQRSHD